MKKVSTKAISFILCILLLVVSIFTLSACEIVEAFREIEGNKIDYNGMTFKLGVYESENGKEDCYMAGNFHNKNALHFFIPMEINGIKVRKIGYPGGLNFGSVTLNLHDLALQKLYMPGTIIGQGVDYEYLIYTHNDMQIYYCGEVIDLHCIYPYNNSAYAIDYFVPADKYDEFINKLGSKAGFSPTTSGFYKANVSYRLNADDLCEYYYVDNIEAGSKIVNIPPEPTRAGYKFAGWYTEKECINKWYFDNKPTVSADETSFVEFSLYAKWTKK